MTGCENTVVVCKPKVVADETRQRHGTLLQVGSSMCNILLKGGGGGMTNWAEVEDSGHWFPTHRTALHMHTRTCMRVLLPQCGRSVCMVQTLGIFGDLAVINATIKGPPGINKNYPEAFGNH